MAAFPDHLECPGLDGLLPRLVGERRAAACVTAPTRGWRPARALTRRARAWPALADAGADLEAVVVVGCLGRPMVADAWPWLAEGGLVVDLSTLPRAPWRARLSPWARRRYAATAAAEHVRLLLDAGLRQLEQWVCIDPRDVVVSIGIKGVPVMAGASGYAGAAAAL